MEAPWNNQQASPLPDSLWASITPAMQVLSPLKGQLDIDVAVVGAGFMGLAAALKLAQSGRTVAVLEAAEPGWGASGRNAGQVIAGLKRDPHEVIRILGQDAGERLLMLSSDAPAR